MCDGLELVCQALEDRGKGYRIRSSTLLQSYVIALDQCQEICSESVTVRVEPLSGALCFLWLLSISAFPSTRLRSERPIADE